MSDDDHVHVEVTAGQFADLFGKLMRWGRWGEDDERGALNLLTPDHVVAAAGLVHSGVTVSMSLPVNTEAALHNPMPADHHMTALGSGGDAKPEGVEFIKDYVGADYHNDGHTHIDALCHVAYDGLLYNGTTEDQVDEDGAAANSIEVLKDGLVGRGVLLDIPRVRGVRWLEPGQHVYRDDLEAAEREQGIAVCSNTINARSRPEAAMARQTR